MEDRKRKTWKEKGKFRSVFGILGALWLVMACLSGCVVSVSGDEGNRAIPDMMMAAQEGDREWTSAEAETENILDDSSTENTTETQKKKKEDKSGESESSTEKKQKETSESSSSEIALEQEEPSQAASVEESGSYTSKEEVALYLHLYGHLPDNYITKEEAENLGWSNREGNLWEVAPGKSIGGNRFGNYEGALPNKKGRKYFECDIDFDGGYRGAKRLIYSNDGLIYYTEDHYNTFEQLYGE